MKQLIEFFKQHDSEAIREAERSFWEDQTDFECIAIARFIGNDSLGYKQGQQYKLKLMLSRRNASEGSVTIYRTDRTGGVCPYNSMVSFLRNWEDIHLYEDEWKQLRKDFFNECAVRDSTDGINTIKIDMAPHDVFEWFKKKLKK